MPGYFLTGEHVNITQWESSQSPRAAFLFMSLNSINGLLSHWTVAVPYCGVFLNEGLVAAAGKCYTVKKCSLCSCSKGCEALVRDIQLDVNLVCLGLVKTCTYIIFCFLASFESHKNNLSLYFIIKGKKQFAPPSCESIILRLPF